jgi:mannose-6-phosphate isomerase-like protein (cupin superfamily)
MAGVQDEVRDYARRCVVRRMMMLAIVGVLLVPFIASARQAPAGLGMKVLVENERVRIQRLSVPAGFTDPVSVAQNDQIAIQITAGEMDVTIGDKKTVGHVDPGTTFYVPKNVQHQFNNAGKTGYDTIVVMLK